MITLKTLGEATEQEVFDQVARHLLSQNISSRDSSGNFCVYRNEAGLKCAAGCLIADAEYSKKLESNTWKDLVYMELVPKVHATLIRELQVVHDDNCPEGWIDLLEEIAKDYGLNSSVLRE